MCKLAVIDDNPLDHFIIRKMLSKNGLFPDALYVTDARQLIDIMGNSAENVTHYPDIVLLDLNMPGFSGWDFLQQIKNFYPRFGKPVDIYILSSSIDPDDELRSKKYPFVKDFIIKPIKQETLQHLYLRYSA